MTGLVWLLTAALAQPAITTCDVAEFPAAEGTCPAALGSILGDAATISWTSSGTLQPQYDATLDTLFLAVSAH
jgi:hypothetical protein